MSSMKKYLLLLAPALLLTQPLYSQTKRIMHRSHSGKDQSQRKDLSEDNFGLSSAQMRQMERVQDSLQAAKRADSLRKAGLLPADSAKAKQPKAAGKKKR